MNQIAVMDVLPLADENCFKRCLETLSDERREKVLSRGTAADRRLSLGAGLLLRDGLRSLGLHEREMRYAKAENGKPYFENRPDLHFNISHSGSKVAVAFAECEVGCDIERVKPINFALARRFFCAEENRFLHEVNEPEEKTERFFRLWTLKESYLKAAGYGLKLPLNEFCVVFDGESVSVFRDGQKTDDVLTEFSDISGYRLACCTERKTAPFYLEQKDLLMIE